MSTKTKNVVKKATRTSGTKPPEKGQVKSEDKDKVKLKPKTVAIKKQVVSPGSSSSSRTNTKVKANPGTPSKATKSLFFPTKQMYTNALKTTVAPTPKVAPTPTVTPTPPIPIDRERHKTRVLSPSEVKVLKPAIIPVDRPRTATITTKDDYEDDFDSYESDFEAYSSSSTSEIASEDISDDVPTRISQETDEERKLDSGNYELPEYKHKQILDNIKESIEQENASVKVATLSSLSDEGYEEGNQFVNFVEATKKFRLKSRAKRGEEILSMIRLDVRHFTLFEMVSVPYETFIKKFGKENSIQSSTQTGDDDVDEETQTELIDSANLWTQFPAKFGKIDASNTNYLTTYRMDLLGVGGEKTAEHDVTYNDDKLNEFLRHASDLILTLLDENRQQTCGDIEVSNEIPFSDGYVIFNTDFVKDLSIDWVSFSTSGNRFISVHNSHESKESKSVVCVWSITNPNRPKNVLDVYGKISCATFGGSDLIIAGLYDGSMVVWDLNDLFVTTTPTFITNVGSGHLCAIRSVAYAASEVNDANCIAANADSQVCSLDEEGTLIIWSVVILQNHRRKTVSLLQNARLSLRDQHKGLEHLRCTDMMVNPLDSNHAFVSTNYGQVVHCVSSGSKVKPKMYVTGDVSQANCLSPCPFSPLFFLCGYQNGNVLLFSRGTEKPLMVMCGCDDKEHGLNLIEWSNNKPCVFYTKDSDSTVHVWDLSLSDIFPTYSLSFKEKIDFIRLSPGMSKSSVARRSYMLVVTENRSINLHVLNKEHGPQSREGYDDDVRKFLNYVDRL